jgi:hypothetical protein
MLPAIFFSRPTTEYREMEVRRAFLFAFNASKLVALYVGVAYLLNFNGVLNIPLGGVGFVGFWLSWTTFMALSIIYVLGFKNRRHRYLILSLGD